MANGRIVIAMLGLDQHEVGAIAVARLLRDAGMEVVYAGRFQTPHSIVQTAIDEDVDLIGISCHSWEFVDFTPELMALIAEKGVDVPVVLGGSVITAGDAEQMKRHGVAAVFGASSSSAGIVGTIAELVSARQRRIHAA
ncbi:MAG: cobalamin-dependent protein [Candidatus Binataceae bacterium]|jgi:methylmalonyl-CoA mutase C-terminal domain/subunit